MCQNYRPISIISDPNQVMLTIILNRLQPEVQADFRARKNIAEQISSARKTATSADSLPCLQRFQETWIG